MQTLIRSNQRSFHSIHSINFYLKRLSFHCDCIIEVERFDFKSSPDFTWTRDDGRRYWHSTNSFSLFVLTTIIDLSALIANSFVSNFNSTGYSSFFLLNELSLELRQSVPTGTKASWRLENVTGRWRKFKAGRLSCDRLWWYFFPFWCVVADRMDFPRFLLSTKISQAFPPSLVSLFLSSSRSERLRKAPRQ